MLAIAETIAASGISFWIAWRLGSIKHIVLASALVPLLLLRTPLSTRYTVRVFRETVSRPYWLQRFSGFIFDVLLLAVIIFWTKALAGIRVFLRTPLGSVQAIPGNFFFGIAVLDVCCPPHFFPGLEREKGSYVHSYSLLTTLCQRYGGFVFRTVKEGLREGRLGPSLVVAVFVPIVISSFVPLILVAFAYRWALKSTAVLWLPLIWLVVQSVPRKEIMARLFVMTHSVWSKTMLVYSALVLLAFVAKLAVLLGIWHFANLDWLGQLGVAATRLVAPFELPLWQVAGAANAILAWLFFFHADQHLLSQGTSEAWPEGWIRQEYALFQVVRTTLSLYVIACTFYISAAVAWETEWPPIRFVLFPWSG